MQVTEHQKGTDGAQPANAAQPDQQTAEQQKLAAGPAAGAVAVEPPEEEKYTVHVPEGLTYFDLDLIKLTAQFVARNGKGFLTGAFGIGSSVTGLCQQKPIRVSVACHQMLLHDYDFLF